MSGLAWILFLVAAGLGAPARYLLDGAVADRLAADHTTADRTTADRTAGAITGAGGRRTAGPLPWGTFVVNVVGSFLLGLLTGFGRYHGFNATAGTVLGTGGLGAFTTFSTFSYETVRLAEDGDLPGAAANAAGSLVVCGLAAAAGLALAAAL